MHRNALARPAFYPYCERGHVVPVKDSGNYCPICWANDHGPDVVASPVALVHAAEPVVMHIEDDETWGLEALPPSPHE